MSLWRSIEKFLVFHCSLREERRRSSASFGLQLGSKIQLQKVRERERKRLILSTSPREGCN